MLRKGIPTAAPILRLIHIPGGATGKEGARPGRRSVALLRESPSPLHSLHSASAHNMASTLLVQPSGEISGKIYKELCEDKSAVPEKMKNIKEWLALQPHLPPFEGKKEIITNLLFTIFSHNHKKNFVTSSFLPIDDDRILTFLRGCKHSSEKVKKKLDMYFSMRAAVPEFYAERDPQSESLQKVWTEVHMPPLPGLTSEGNRVIWMCSAQPELNISSASTAMKLALMIGDLRLKLEEHGVAGDVYVLDAAHATAQQFAKFTPAIIRKFLISVQEAYPVRLRQVHVININPLVDVIFNFVKPLLKEKIKNRIHFHSKMDTFYKIVPAEMCPTEYGGQGGSLKDISGNWKKTVEENRQWFLDQETVKADETRRPGKQMNYDELFGASGSFRKLNID
ncbi:Hypothetical predicted protein [Cloeon dipterum]|uniref:CRAL-TRIO domain-containing protein n=1 Tax=Cloeon dipterum TaxID=197152 RepID=A0A8S1BPH5_9INSE|nr:Hypothetical predicted protein [Cloeon dipterum]